MIRVPRLAWIGLCLVLTACANLDTSSSRDTNPAAVPTNWEARGKATISSAERTDSVNFRWRQAGESSELQVSGPIGWGRYTLYSDGPGDAPTLGEEFSGLSEQERAQVRRQLAVLPISAMSEWLLGLCSECAAADSNNTEDQETAKEFKQGEWQVSYQAFQQVEGLTLPRKMRFSGPAGSGKLLITKWQLLQSGSY